jgi:hypothetical protein
MDIAAAGAAASQISSAQRMQQVALSGIKQARVQGATLANLLSNVAAPASAGATNAVSAPSSTSNDNQVQADQPSRNLPRGSLVNLLV